MLASRSLSTGEAHAQIRLYRALRTELHRHDFSTFADEPPSIAQGGRGVVVPGCPTCKKDLSGYDLPGKWNYFGVAWHPKIRLSLSTLIGLFVSQGDHWIDFHRPARRDVTR
jgi:hypothetical protein